MSARVRAVLVIGADPVTVWDRITDWRAHGRWIPLTQVRLDPSGPGTGLGTRFTGRTSLGPFGFDDPMQVVEWQPATAASAGSCRIVKHGRHISGWAEIVVAAHPVGSEVSWTEEIAIRGLPRAVEPVNAFVGRLLFARALRKLAAEVCWPQ